MCDANFNTGYGGTSWNEIHNDNVSAITSFWKHFNELDNMSGIWFDSDGNSNLQMTLETNHGKWICYVNSTDNRYLQIKEMD